MNDPLRAQQMVRRQVRRRRRRHRLRLALLVLLATTAVLGAAFGIDRLAVAVHKFYDEHHHSHPRATGPTTKDTSTTTTTAPGPPHCGSAQLSAVVADWRNTGSAVEESVALTNISPTTCTLAGYPVLGAAAQNGTALPATNDDLATFGNPTTTGTTFPTGTASGTTVPPGPVSLVHGARASFEFAYADTCTTVLAPGGQATGAANECYPGVWLEVTPTAGSSPLIVTVPVHLTYGTSGFEVGPFQAGSGSPLSGQPPLSARMISATGSAGPAPTP